MSDYRIPKLEEFVQGFEFEVAQDYKFGFMDFSDVIKPLELSDSNRIWITTKVWWKNNPKERIIEKDINGITWDISGGMVNFFKPFDEESFIKQGLVRVKADDKLLSQ